MCVCSGLQGERRLVHHDVPFGGCGPQGLLGGRSSDPSKLAATVRQQGQLETQDNIVSRGNYGNITGLKKKKKKGQDLHSVLSVLALRACFVYSYPVVHVLLGVRCQDQRPPLFGPFRRVHGEGEVSLSKQRNQRRHFV